MRCTGYTPSIRLTKKVTRARPNEIIQIPTDREKPGHSTRPSLPARILIRGRGLGTRLIKNRVASFLTQGNIACENILGAGSCTAVRTGANMFVSVLYIYI